MVVLQFLTKITNKIGMQGTPCLGLIMTAVGCLFIYPVPPIPKSIISIIFGLCMTGGAGAPLNVPALINLSKYLKIYEPTLDDFTANDIASTLYSIVNDIGDFIGPILGGFLSSEFGFKNCCLYISIFIFIYLFLFFLTFFEEIKNEFKEEREDYDFTEIKGALTRNITFSDLSDTFIRLNSHNLFGTQFAFIKRKQSFIKSKDSEFNTKYTLLHSLTNTDEQI